MFACLFGKPDLDQFSFYCGCFDLWLLNVLNGSLSFDMRKIIELKMFFLLVAEPMVSAGVGGCSPLLSVSCSAMLLCIPEGFPNEAPEVVTRFAIKTYTTLCDVEPWDLVKRGS